MPQNAMSIPKEAFEIAKAGVYKAKKGKSQRWPTSLDPSSAANEPQLQVPQPAHLSHEIPPMLVLVSSPASSERPVQGSAPFGLLATELIFPGHRKSTAQNFTSQKSLDS